MIKIKVTREQLNYARELVHSCNFGNRGTFDGDKTKQLIGMLAQTMVCDYLGHERPTASIGFDGGYDLVINGKKVDVKCMGRKTDVRPSYVHNLVGYQINYDCDYYIFTSLNIVAEELTICGVVSQSEFKRYSYYYPKGCIRYRGNGSKFKLKAPLYELEQTRLTLLGNVDNKEDIERRCE